jgi:hypothetical protein
LSSLLLGIPSLILLSITKCVGVVIGNQFHDSLPNVNSKTLAPIYEQLADAFQHGKDNVIIAKVDADAHRALGERFGVTGISSSQ